MTPPKKPKPPPAKDEGLLDPEAFWDADPGPESAQAPLDLTKPEDSETDSEVLVVSSPAGPPSELYLPKEDRQVKPQPPAGPRPKPRPIPTRAPRPVSRVADRKPGPPRVWIGAVVICLIGLGGWQLWRSLAGNDGSTDGDRASGLDSKIPASDQDPSASVESPGRQDAPVRPDEQQEKGTGARQGTLKLTSDPPGAVVFVNDQRSGATPTTLKGIQAGATLNIRIEAQGFRPWTQKVVFDGRDLNREFHAGLLEEDACRGGSGWVYVTSAPPGATVELDEKRLPGKTPMVIDSVCAGKPHRIRVQARGFRTWWQSFTLTAGQVLNLKVDMKK